MASGDSPVIPQRVPLRLVPRQCKLQQYDPISVPSYRLAGELIAYASPDSTYAVTKRLLDGARQSILIGIYDFTAPYMKDVLVAAKARGVKISVMLDLDGRKGESGLWEDLLRQGIEGVPAPSCASAHARYFPSCHEKVIVVDDEWTLVQSGNYSDASIPENETDGGDPAHFIPGNRDMGVAIKSAPLAAFFTQVLRSDMQLELGALHRGLRGHETPEIPQMLPRMATPPQVPPKLFPSRHLQPANAVQVVPVLSPDNYMQIIPSFLASATRSIDIEQQYIRGAQPEIRKLLGAIRQARDTSPNLVVRIVLALPYGSDGENELESITALSEFGLGLGTHIRFLNPRYLVHCHNKLIIVDRQAVVVGSQNWSDFAVTKNREAALLVRYPQLARYFAAIFSVDWKTGLTSLPPPVPAAPITRARGTMSAPPVSIGDYVEV